MTSSNKSSSSSSSSDIAEDVATQRDDSVSEMYKDYNLYLAAKNGHLDEFKTILDQIQPAESVDDILSRLSPAGNTFLHVASKHGNKDIVAFIAGKVPSLLYAKNLSGETALHLLARDGDESMVKSLVEIHRDLLLSQPLPDQYDEAGLLMAENGKGNTALEEAILNGEESIAEYLIQQDPELSYHQNRKSQSALYLAAKRGFLRCVGLILQQCKDEERLDMLFKEKSPIRAALKRKHNDVLEAILDAKPRLIEIRDDKGKTPLHFAASMGHFEGARYLLNKYSLSATQKDRDGALPIHLAAFEGHVDIIGLFLQNFPDAGELLDRFGCSFLHVAAKSGRHDVFDFVLNDHRLDYLINMKDNDGNTPLHWASAQFHPKVVSTLTWDKRVDVHAINNDKMTALNVAESDMSNPEFRERLTWAALRAASIPRRSTNRSFYAELGDMESASYLRGEVKDEASKRKSKYFDAENYKERVNTLLLVATLVATVTFAAGFTMPGGYNSSDNTDLGMATMLRQKGFHVFVFCDTIAMYSSIVAVTALIWAQLGDLTLAITALTLAVPLLGIALSMMSVAFAAGIVVVVTNLKWLATTILALGIAFVAILFLLLLPLCTPLTSRSRILRYLSYYPFRFLVLVTGSSSETGRYLSTTTLIRSGMPMYATQPTLIESYNE